MSADAYDATLVPIRSREGTPGEAIRRRVRRTSKTGAEGAAIYAADDGFWIEIATDPDDRYSPRAVGWPEGHRGYQLTELWPAEPSE